jgi:hypothetical protein
MNIPQQIYCALDAAHKENKYPHDYARDPDDVVAEIHDWTGILNFDPEFMHDAATARVAVREWRKANPPPPTTV